MPRINVKVDGLQEALKKLEDMRDVTAKGKLTDALVKGAGAIAGEAEARAPRGPSGNLKRSLKAFGARFSPGKPMAAFALAVRKLANHIHLVAFGRKAIEAGYRRFSSSGKRVTSAKWAALGKGREVADGKAATGKKALFGLAMSGFPNHPVKRVKAQPPNPFFQEAQAASRSKARREVEDAIKAIIERAAGGHI